MNGQVAAGRSGESLPVQSKCSSPPRGAAGADARVGCEPGQVRKEAALSGTGLVPSVSRSRSAAGCFMRGLGMLSPQQQQLWEAYQRVESRGCRQEKVSALEAFVEAVRSTPRQQWR